MVRLSSLLGLAAFVSLSLAAPMPKPDSANGEIPVSAPNGVPTSDAAAAATQAAAAHPSDPAALTSSIDTSTATAVDSAASTLETPPPSIAPPSSMAPPPSEGLPPSQESPSSITYGSGSKSWGGSSYNDCVQQCIAKYGGSPQEMSPSPTEEGSGGMTGNNGVTHTVIVAPSQGVLRYVPFSLNASVGDTISFKWWAGPHTVTRSSALEVCNKTDAAPFASGQQQKGFTFNEVVNDTKPIWIYCGVPGHCQKGMFMGINIGQPNPSGDTIDNFVPLSSMMTNMTEMSSDMSAMWRYTLSQTGGNSYARQWGMSTNVAGMSPDAMMMTAQNVMWTQTLIAANPSNVQDGTFVPSDNMKIPMDLQVALASSPSSTGGNSGSATSGSSPSAAAASASASTKPHSGASSVTYSSLAVALTAAAASFLAL